MGLKAVSYTHLDVYKRQVLGPIGWAIGNFMCDVIMAGFNSSFGWLFGGIYGMLYPLLVITGMHHAMLPIDIQIAASGQGLFTFPIVALCNIAQATAVLAFAYILSLIHI